MAEGKPSAVRRLLRVLGPGVITGAADDDPAGIATYSIAGARFGTALLWLAPLTWPLMAAVQSMCARVGMVTGGGLMSALRRKFPRPVLLLAAAALFCANTFNVGADLAGMADAAELLTGLDSRAWVMAFGVAIAWATIALHYVTIARILKWLALALFAYILAAFSLGPDWSEVARATLLPHIPRGPAAWATILAILGTTISPYLFFWQASEEVEEEKARGRGMIERVGATRGEIRMRNLDVGVGTFFCNFTFFFIILTTALTLHRHGIKGMDERLSGAPGFYGVFALSIGSAMAMDFADFSAVRALYVSAIINGLLAPFLLAGILAVASDRRIMAGQPSSRLVRATVLITTLAMLTAAAAMFFV